MQRTIRRLSVGVLVAAASSALAAAPAMATTVTTGSATSVKTTTAVLHATIDTGGVATAWQFQLGKTKSYGRGTPLQQIGPGQGVVTVTWRVRNLSPNTKYHFRIAATTSTGQPYYLLNAFFGNDHTFTTKTTGKLLLTNKRLTVTHGVISVPLRCDSSIACRGRFTINTRAKLQGSKKVATVLCATRTFTIRARRTSTLTVRASGACVGLLTAAHSHSIAAKLTSNPRTGQRAIISQVTLALL